MWNPFKKKHLLSDDSLHFQIETFKWLLTYFGGDAFYKDTTLILPTEEFFPNIMRGPEELAESTFRCVQKYVGMDNWPCELQEQEPDPDYKVAPTTIIKGGEYSPLGTFSAKNSKKVIITYNPAIISDPSQLVATFAHELAHYLTGTCQEPPPGGWDNWEFATDIAGVFMGFGIFLANSAFSFSQYTDIDSQGWSTSRSGYLSEPEFAFSLAVFLKLQNHNASRIYKYLDTNIKAYVKRSFAELDKSQHIEQLQQIKCKTMNS